MKKSAGQAGFGGWSQHTKRLKRLAEMFEEALHLVMTADKGEPDLVRRAPEEDPLGESGADLPQVGTQLRQAKTARQLLCRQRTEKQINATFELQLLDGMKAFEAASEGGIEAVVHLQAPEVPQGSLGCAKCPCASPAFGQPGQRGDLFFGEWCVRHDRGLRDHHPARLDEEPDGTPLSAQMEGLTHQSRQAHLSLSIDLGRNKWLSHRLLDSLVSDSSQRARRQETA